MDGPTAQAAPPSPHAEIYMDKGMTMLDAEAGFVRKLLCFHMLLFMNRLLDYKYFRFLHAYKSSFASPETIGCTI